MGKLEENESIMDKIKTINEAIDWQINRVPAIGSIPLTTYYLVNNIEPKFENNVIQVDSLSEAEEISQKAKIPGELINRIEDDEKSLYLAVMVNWP